MIVRQFCVRQSRNIRSLNQTSRVLARFSSTETTTTRTETIEGAPVLPRTDQFNQVLPTPEEDVTSPVREAYWSDVKRHAKFNKLGSSVKGKYKPESILKNPPRPSDITLELLLASQTHLGHSTSRWNPQNSRYIFGVRDGIHIISLDVTAAYLRRAAKVVEEVARRGGIILFAGTRKGQKQCVVRAAELSKGYHIFERWIPGSLTNGQQILGSCETKVVNAIDQELPEFAPHLAQRSVLKPHLVVCFNPMENEVLLHECGLHNIPTIGIIDTDADSTRVTYPIPANDDSLRCVQLIAGILGRAGEEGQRRRMEEAAKGILSYEPVKPEDIKDNPAAED